MVHALARIVVLFALAACGAEREPYLPEVPDGLDPIGEVDTSGSPSGVVPLPEHVDARLRRWFDRYTCARTPSGRPLHVLAQSGWREEQIVRVRLVLEHLLRDAPGARLGSDKSAVAEAMADRRATMVLFDDVEAMERAFEDGLWRVPLGMQDLRANECPVEGDPDDVVHATRDAAFEEVLHLVHDYGLRPVHPDYDRALHEASEALAARGLWQGWPEDEPENWRNEYFAAAYDNYLDLWAVPPTLYEGEPIAAGDLPAGTSHFGRFPAGSRAGLREVDPLGFALIEDFFPPELTYPARLPPEFEGTYFLAADPRVRHSLSAQHLRHVELSGARDANLLGNDHDNVLIGNAGDNRLEGAGGDDELCGGGGQDLLLGGDGTDTARFRGALADYAVESERGVTTVRDLVEGRDGLDHLEGVERVAFADGTFALPELEPLGAIR